MTFDLFGWISRGLAAFAVAVDPRPAEPLSRMSDDRLALAIKTFHNVSWWLRDSTKEAWVSIPKVKVTEKFMGWGYVEGRDCALKINRRVHVIEADDCIDFSEYCVLIEGMPCLLILRKGNDVGVTIIAERDFLADVFSTSMMRCNNIEDFYQMPEPVQKIMHDVFEKVLILRESAAEKQASQVTAIDKMVEY